MIAKSLLHDGLGLLHSCLLETILHDSLALPNHTHTHRLEIILYDGVVLPVMITWASTILHDGFVLPPLMVTWKLKPFCLMFYVSSTMVTWLVLLTHSYVKPFCMMVWSYGLVLPTPGYSKPLCMMIFSSPPLIVIGKHSAWWFSPPLSWLRERWNYSARRCILSAFTKPTWRTISVMVCMRAACQFIHLLIFTHTHTYVQYIGFSTGSEHVDVTEVKVHRQNIYFSIEETMNNIPCRQY
jgi:hypothetical protein